MQYQYRIGMNSNVYIHTKQFMDILSSLIYRISCYSHPLLMVHCCYKIHYHSMAIYNIKYMGTHMGGLAYVEA